MYGGSSKLGGRGGGRGGGGGGGGTKRLSSSFPPPPPHRPSATSMSRLSLGGGRNRAGPTAATSATAVEENFSLVPGNNPLAFAMIIRLAPDLVDEIRKVEAQSGVARMKFDSMANGNVIDVGGKEFKFTWSREFGDLCDIYEERRSGEDGNGLLVESGCAWRKVNVQRILDESTKNHVKMRSEEAERKHKSRKAIVLDHENPSMKSQIKQLAAAESNPWRLSFKQKKDPPFKKRKFEPPQVGGPSKSTFKSGLSSTASAKSRMSSSPLPSPPEQSGAPASPFGTGSVSKSHMNTEEILLTQMKSKENAANSEKEILNKATGAVQGTPARKVNIASKPMDLQSSLITLLMENPKGMSPKALENAVEDAFPNSAKKIEPILKRIATFQAPGRYVLKPGVHLESFKKPSSEGGSSPEDNHQQTFVSDGSCGKKPSTEPSVAETAAVLEEQAQLHSTHVQESMTVEKIDIQQHSPDLFGEKKASDNSQGQAGTSSDSGSDSDSESDSSGSGSDSRSRSRSRGGSGSGSSSDSESDASSNSKEGSDEDVDIMTSDDDKELQHKLQASEPGFHRSPSSWRYLQNEADEKLDAEGSDAIDIEGNGSDAVDIEGNGSAAVDIEGNGSAAVELEGHEFDAVDIDKGLADDEKEIGMFANDGSVPSKEGGKPVGAKSISSNHDVVQEHQTLIGNLFDDNEDMVRESSRHEQSDSSERTSKSKTRRGSDMKHLEKKSEHSKRLKAESLAHVPVSGGRDNQFPENPHSRCIEDNKGPAMNIPDREVNTDFGSRRGFNQAFPGKPNSNFQQSERRSSDQNAQGKPPDTAGRSKQAESLGHLSIHTQKDSYFHDCFSVQREKAPRDAKNDNNSVKEKKGPRNSKEGAGGRIMNAFDSHYRKQEEILGKFKDEAQIATLHMGSSPKDNSKVDVDKYPVVNGRSLQRELSDLELGELREPLPEETPVKRQFERKGSFKQSDNKPSTSDNYNSNLGKGKRIGKATLDSGKPSPPIPISAAKKTPEPYVSDMARSNSKIVQPQPQQLSRVENADVGSHSNKLADTGARLRQNEAGVKPGNSVEGYGESHKKTTVNAHLHDSKRGPLSHSTKESKMQASNAAVDLMNRQTECNNNAWRMRELSEEDDSSYCKYEKDVPELKGPIKDFTQYKEYLQEYQDKYENYCSLNKIIESYRNEFQKLGKDLEFVKGRDMDRYDKTLQQLRESYRRCGPRHKRLKKIFVVLHEELEHLKRRIKDFAQSYMKD